MWGFRRMRLKSLVFSILFLVLPLKNVLAEECVILLHALGHNAHSMNPIASQLAKSHYLIVSHSYPSNRKPIQILAEENVTAFVQECQQHNASKIHFVTHSLGGIILRAYLQNHRIENLGRVVMLAPPNHGSQLADLLKNNFLFRLITGSAGQELTTSQTSLPNVLNPSIPGQLGIIAGNFSLSPVMNYLCHEENDGKVTVSSTKMQQMKDFLILPVGHTFMTYNRLVIKEVAHFLKTGQFDRTVL